MSGWERLSAVDASFLVLESDRTPMHVAAVLTLDKAPFVDAAGRIRLDDIRTYVDARLHLAPRLRQVVREVPLGLHRPVWADDQDFDLGHHIRLAELPSPGGREALDTLVEELIMTVLDRSRPLWEWWVVDGLDDDRIAIVEKLHHALIDGVSGVQLLSALTDLADFAPPADGSWIPGPRPTDAQLVADALGEQVREPWRLTAAAAHLVRTGRDGARRVMGTAEALAAAIRPAVGAPASVSLNQPVGRRRRLRSIELSLTEVKTIAHAHETKVNDVVLTLVSGGLRALLQSRGESVSGHTLHALVPENVRRDDEHLALGNRVSGFFAPLPVYEADAVRSLECIREAMRHKHESHEDETAGGLLGTADHAPYALLRVLGPAVHAQPWVNTVVTNIPGPRDDLTMMGARIRSITPVVPLARNLTIGVAVLSYGDVLSIALNTCRDACPDLDVMVDGMLSTLDELSAASTAVSRRRVARPRRG
jgi:WS/DGAT/MGAT family acyltransferase